MKNTYLKILNTLLLLVTALFFYKTVNAEGLHIETLQPPMVPSLYSGSYTENPAGQTRREFGLNGHTRAYQVYAPTFSREPRPLVLLHGAGRTGVSLVDKWRPIADQYDVILIGPHGTNKGWNWQTDGSEFLLSVLNDAKKHYAIDKSRIYLFGHSAGANIALYFSIFHSDIFAATAVHAGQFQDVTHYNLINDAKRKIPIAFINGTSDKEFPIENVRSSANAFALRGHKTSLIILNGHNHWYYDISDFINRKAWDFLSEHHL